MLVKHDQQKIDLETIENLEIIKKFYENKQAQRGLINLYFQSQAECMRNGVYCICLVKKTKELFFYKNEIII